MLTTIITEEQWQKLKPILLDLNIYDKPSLKETFLGIIYRLKTGCPWRYLPNCYGGRLRKRKIKHVKPIADARY